LTAIGFKPQGDAIAMTVDTTPFVHAYPWSSGFGTKYANPATLPAGNAESVVFKPQDEVIVVGHNTTPFISAYPWALGFGTKYANPATLPTSTVTDMSFI